MTKSSRRGKKKNKSKNTPIKAWKNNVDRSDSIGSFPKWSFVYCVYTLCTHSQLIREEFCFLFNWIDYVKSLISWIRHIFRLCLVIIYFVPFFNFMQYIKRHTAHIHSKYFQRAAISETKMNFKLFVVFAILVIALAGSAFGT